MMAEAQDQLENAPKTESPGAAAALRAETAGKTGPAPAAPEDAGEAAKVAETTTRAAAAKASGKATEYVVFYSESPKGPFTLIDTYITQGQTNAKREGAKTVGIDDAEKFFFTAIPTSSFRPEKPSITLQISFATEDATEEEEREELL